MFTKSALALAIVLATAAGALAATKQSRFDQRTTVNNPYAWESMQEQIRQDTFTHD